MTSKIHKINKWITYSFYALFGLTPLLMFPGTYEIFEFNKMWFVFAVTIFIAFLWATKMILSREIIFKRTLLDIPLLIFLVTQIIATFYSIDPYVSWWGYYSRFNGGLLSTITYIFLYLALTTHLYLSKKDDDGSSLSIKILLMSLFGGTLVALWGLPSHFGFDPTCMLFGRGISTECWTDAFKPTIRIFSTLGQPNWLAAYLATLIPLAIAFAGYVSVEVNKILPFMEKIKLNSRQRMQIFFSLLSILFFIDLLYTRSKSGYIGLWVGLLAMMALYFIPIFYQKRLNIKKITMYPVRQTTIALTFVLLLLTFIIGVPLEGIDKFTLQGLIEKNKESTTSVQNPITGDALGGTDSGNIRLIVWEGGIEMVKNYPFFGTGPETFGYAYYKFRPVEHNYTSEWDYLYNKAHNEYLNYAATSGILGLLSYLIVISVFLISTVFLLRKKSEYKIIATALVGGYVSILISNFFGFSVVNTNLSLFLIPAIFYSILSSDKNKILKFGDGNSNNSIGTGSIILIAIIAITALGFEIKLLRMWSADRLFAHGSNLNKVNEIAEARDYLENAVEMRPQEDLFRNELSLNLSTYAYAASLQQMATEAAILAEEAKFLSDTVVQNHPHNIVFYKTRARSMLALAIVDPKYMKDAIEAIEYAKALAPTDAKVSYNVGIMYGQAGRYDDAINEFRNTIKLKRDYRDPYYGTALVAIQASETSPEKATEYNQIAREALNGILENVNPDDIDAKDLLNSLN